MTENRKNSPLTIFISILFVFAGLASFTGLAMTSSGADIPVFSFFLNSLLWTSFILPLYFFFAAIIIIIPGFRKDLLFILIGSVASFTICAITAKFIHSDSLDFSRANVISVAIGGYCLALLVLLVVILLSRKFAENNNSVNNDGDINNMKLSFSSPDSIDISSRLFSKPKESEKEQVLDVEQNKEFAETENTNSSAELDMPNLPPVPFLHSVHEKNDEEQVAVPEIESLDDEEVSLNIPENEDVLETENSNDKDVSQEENTSEENNTEDVLELVDEDTIKYSTHVEDRKITEDDYGQIISETVAIKEDNSQQIGEETLASLNAKIIKSADEHPRAIQIFDEEPEQSQTESKKEESFDPGEFVLSSPLEEDLDEKMFGSLTTDEELNTTDFVDDRTKNNPVETEKVVEEKTTDEEKNISEPEKVVEASDEYETKQETEKVIPVYFHKENPVANADMPVANADALASGSTSANTDVPVANADAPVANTSDNTRANTDAPVANTSANTDALARANTSANADAPASASTSANTSDNTKANADAPVANADAPASENNSANTDAPAGANNSANADAPARANTSANTDAPASGSTSANTSDNTRANADAPVANTDAPASENTSDNTRANTDAPVANAPASENTRASTSENNSANTSDNNTEDFSKDMPLDPATDPDFWTSDEPREENDEYDEIIEDPIEDEIVESDEEEFSDYEETVVEKKNDNIIPEKKSLIEKAKKKNEVKYYVPTDILQTYPGGQYWIIDESTKKAGQILVETLAEFGIESEVTGISKGPVITMFEILPAPGIKLARIAGLSDNIALRLAASSVRIVAPIPGKHAVGIEVPNAERAIVSFKESVESDAFKNTRMQVPVILGKDISGEVRLADITQTPHLLIAGATGSGKSVCVNSIILSILYHKSFNEVKLILIDPKIVELKLYNDIPHLLTPVITEPKKAFQALQYCLCEMERRYSLLDHMGVRDIKAYNRKLYDKKMAADKLPYIVVIIDEFADLMATTGKELESTLARLAAMSRAVGIHIVLATQRPSIDVITGLIKANIPSRIAFMVAGKFDSRIIIDQVGAENLLGRGDMLYASATDAFPIRMQGSFVSDEEVERVVEYVKTLGEPDYIDEEIFVDDEEETTSLFAEEEEDPLYEKALDIVLSQGKASASFLQRKLKIGYNRAARLVELMEDKGIVGKAQGSKPRDVIHNPNFDASRTPNPKARYVPDFTPELDDDISDSDDNSKAD